MKALFALLITILLAGAVSARERREFYNGIRGLGMGDTGVAIVNDETALALNPAGLGRVRDFYGTIIDPELDIGWNLTNMYRVQAFSQPLQLESVAPTAIANAGTYYHSRLQFMPSFVARNFGIGLLSRTTLNVEADDPNNPNSLNTFYRDDLALLLGYNLRLFDGRVKLGVTGKIISRIEIDDPAIDGAGALDAASLGAADILKEGVGAGLDAGLLLTAPWTYLPTLGVVLRDSGGTPFDKMSGVRNRDAISRPTSAVQDADVAFSISPILQRNVRSTWTVEYRGLLTAADETDKAKLMHFGMEYNFGDLFFVRAGYNQRYWTAGLELASEKFQFQLASYGEEIGTVEAPREDRRYVMKVALRF